MSNIPEFAADKLLRELRRNDPLAQAATMTDPFNDIMRQARLAGELNDPVIASARAAFEANKQINRLIEDAGGITSVFERSKLASTAIERAMQDIDRTPRLFRDMINTQSAVAMALARTTDSVAVTRFAAVAQHHNNDAFTAFATSVLPDGLADLRQRMVDDHSRFQKYITGALPHIERLQREMAVPATVARLLHQTDEFTALANSLEQPLAGAMKALHQQGLTASDYAQMQASAFNAADAAAALFGEYDTGDAAPDAGEIQSLLEGLIAIFVRFGANGRRERAELGPIAVFGYLLGIMGILLAIFPPETNADRESAEAIARLEQSVSSLTQSLIDQDAESVAGLDRAIVLRTAWVRHEPRKRGGRMIRLQEGTVIALRQKSGPWWQIAYRDALTGKIMDGWIYESLIEKIG
jgi:hypothetical protein